MQMSKKEYIDSVADDMVRINNKSFINVTEFARFLGISRDRAREMLHRLTFSKNGNEKLYYVKEVASLLWEDKTRSH